MSTVTHTLSSPGRESPALSNREDGLFLHPFRYNSSWAGGSKMALNKRAHVVSSIAKDGRRSLLATRLAANGIKLPPFDYGNCSTAHN